VNLARRVRSGAHLPRNVCAPPPPPPSSLHVFGFVKELKIPSSGIITPLSLFKASSTVPHSLDEILIHKWVQFALPK
jgi:hypothetical protein